VNSPCSLSNIFLADNIPIFFYTHKLVLDNLLMVRKKFFVVNFKTKSLELLLDHVIYVKFLKIEFLILMQLHKVRLIGNFILVFFITDPVIGFHLRNIGRWGSLRLDRGFLRGNRVVGGFNEDFFCHEVLLKLYLKSII
jgi:hypothetical protein